MKHLLACLCLGVIACQSPEGPEPDPGLEPNPLPKPIPNPNPLGTLGPELWEEKLPDGVVYFAGCRTDSLATDQSLGGGAGEGRFTLLVRCWTDVSFCTPVGEGRECTAFQWTNRYEGSFRREDSSLAFTYRFISSTAPEHAPIPGEDSGEVAFKLKQIEPHSRLVLERLGDGKVDFGKPALELNRLR